MWLQRPLERVVLGVGDLRTVSVVNVSLEIDALTHEGFNILYQKFAASLLAIPYSKYPRLVD